MRDCSRRGGLIGREMIRYMCSKVRNSFDAPGMAEADVLRCGYAGDVGSSIGLALILVLIVGRDMRHGGGMKLT